MGRAAGRQLSAISIVTSAFSGVAYFLAVDPASPNAIDCYVWPDYPNKHYHRNFELSGLCIIGLQWGDEAKGKMVDLLSQDCDVVVRYQGGSNAGHTVVVGDETYKLHHIPSGIIHGNVLNVIGPGVVVNPETILHEIEGLEARGHDLPKKLVMSDRAHVVCPWHVLEDQLTEQIKDDQEKIGTTLRGIGPCYRDKVGRNYAIRLGDLIDPNLETKLRRVIEFKLRFLSAFGDEAVSIDAESVIAKFSAYGQKLKPYIRDTNRILFDAIDSNKLILLEGAQGALLDIDHGTFPYVTSSNSSGVGVCAGSGVPPRSISKVLGIAKCYSTRVGGGPFPTELKCETGEHIRQQGNEFGTTTGRPRRCGWFDAVAVKYTAQLSGVDQLSMMMLDVLSQLDEIKVCVGYELDGEKIDYFPGPVDQLRAAVPIYETLPGWNTDVTQVRSFDDLPENAVAYLSRISELVRCPIQYVSVGPDRAQTIECPSDWAAVANTH